jgi:HlyD family secretion protein
VIRTDNPNGMLRPGMTANVTVRIERRDDVLRVPNAALRFRPANAAGRGGAMASGTGQGGGGGRRAAAGGGEAQAATPGASDGDSRGGWRERMKGLSPEERQRVRDSMMTARGGAGADADAGLTRRGAAGGDARGLRTTAEPGSGPEPGPTYRPGAVQILVNGKPSRVALLTGITDGAFTEVRTDKLKPGDLVIVGMEASSRGANLQPPPGMGGPQFRGPGGGRGGR